MALNGLLCADMPLRIYSLTLVTLITCCNTVWAGVSSRRRMTWPKIACLRSAVTSGRSTSFVCSLTESLWTTGKSQMLRSKRNDLSHSVAFVMVHNLPSISELDLGWDSTAGWFGLDWAATISSVSRGLVKLQLTNSWVGCVDFLCQKLT